MNSHKAVGIWVRVSTEMQEDSPEHHQKRAEFYAQAKDWEVKRVYRLDAVSGKSLKEHPSWQQMMEDIKSGVISGLIFSKLARVARNTKELLELSDFFREHGADMISLEESLDTSSPAGRFFYTLLAAMAQWEREEIASRVAASVPIRAKMGKPLGGASSFGYRWVGKDFVIDEKEAPVRKLMYELFLKYRRKKTVATELNKMGYRTRNGSPFSDTTVDRLLKDPTAKGIRICNHTKSNGDGGNWKMKPKEDWVVHPCPPIITERLWNECNDILTRQRESRRKPSKMVTYLLAGYVHCSCGRKMYVFHESSEKYVCKKCKNRILIRDLDEIYQGQLQSFLISNNDITAYKKRNDETLNEKQRLLDSTKSEFTKLSSQMSKLVSLRADKELTKEQFEREYNPFEERYSQLEKQLPELEAEVDFLKIHFLSADAVFDEAKSLYERWDTLPFHNRRGIVEVITDKISIGKTDIEIELSYSPSPHTPLSLQKSGNAQYNFMDS